MNKLGLENSLKRLNQACFVFAGLLGISLLIILGLGLSRLQSAHGTEAAIAVMKNRLQEEQTKVDKAKAIAGLPMVHGLEAAGAFQIQLETLAAKHSVEVSEFRSGTDLMPFLSAYSKDTASEGWSQIDAKAALHGRLVDIFSCLTELGRERIPFEFDTIELSRAMDQPGQVRVSATIQMRVLTRAGGSKA